MADSFGQFNAALLYCNKCGQAMPVRQRLLLVLPDGEMYDYTCQRCNSSVGSKTEKAGQSKRRCADKRKTQEDFSDGSDRFGCPCAGDGATWDYMLESERALKPRIVPTPNDPTSGGESWLIDGTYIGKARNVGARYLA